MAISSGQVTVPTGGTVLTRLPAGVASVSVSNLGTAVIYVGASTSAATISTTSGMPVPAGGVFTFQLFNGNPGYNLVAVTGGGSSTAGFLVCTSVGLPQPGVN